MKTTVHVVQILTAAGHVAGLWYIWGWQCVVFQLAGAVVTTFFSAIAKRLP